MMILKEYFICEVYTLSHIFTKDKFAISVELTNLSFILFLVIIRNIKVKLRLKE